MYNTFWSNLYVRWSRQGKNNQVDYLPSWCSGPVVVLLLSAQSGKNMHRYTSCFFLRWRLLGLRWTTSVAYLNICTFQGHFSALSFLLPLNLPQQLCPCQCYSTLLFVSSFNAPHHNLIIYPLSSLGDYYSVPVKDKRCLLQLGMSLESAYLPRNCLK